MGAQRSLARGQPGTRPARHSRERHDAGADGHGDDLRCAAAGVGRANGQRAARARRHHRRRGRDRPVRAQRGVVLSERSRDTGRWWPDGARRHEVALGCRPGRGIQAEGKPPIARVSTARSSSSPSAASNVDSVALHQMLRIGRHRLPFSATRMPARTPRDRPQYTSASRNIPNASRFFPAGLER